MNKEFTNDLDTLYQYYLTNREEHLEYVSNITIDHILIGLYLSLNEVPLPQLNKVYVNKSNIEGLGVFAACNINKGEIVSMYPSDVVRIYNGNKYCEFKSDRCNKVDLKHAYKVSKNTVIFGDPTLLDNMNLVGNMINDCINTDFKPNVEYYPYNIFVLIVACHDIKKDEELLVSYGVDYWATIHKNDKY